MEHAIWGIELFPEITVGLFPSEIYLQVNVYVLLYLYKLLCVSLYDGIVDFS